MPILTRNLPDPLPAIHPLPEYAVDGDRLRRYQDMKAALQVPWMGVVTMAYAHYPTFFDTFWEALKPAATSQAYVDAARRIRNTAEDHVRDGLSAPPIAERLADMGYGAREIDNIRAMIEIFSHGNTTYYPLVMAVTLLIEGHEIGSAAEIGPPANAHAPDSDVPFVLMEPHHADPPTRAVYDDIKSTLGLPFVNTDYRALARWPSYFAMAWQDLKPQVGTPPHRAIADAVHENAIEAALNLPNPHGLAPGDLIAAAEQDATHDEVRQMCRLFHYLIPELIANVAFFRAQFLTR